MSQLESGDGLHKTACILCSVNCGIEVGVDEGRLVKIRGDRDHPVSHGYLCQKAARLDYYQNHADRLDRPLRRRADGTFEAITWDQAIGEIAARLVELRDTHSGRSLAYYGGGGQGNHLGGVYAAALRSAMGTRYYYSALAQEKTGDFWVNGKLFGRQTCHITDDVDNAQYVIFLGTNPWQSHGFPRARAVLQEIAKDPARTMVVIDPRRTETAELADIHLQLLPGTDAFLLAAILGTIVQEGLEDREFLATRTDGFDRVADVLRGVPVERYAEIAGVEVDQVRKVARGLAAASSATIRADLGIQQSLNSTLNSYLEKLLFLLTGNLGKPGSNNFHTFLLPLIGHSAETGEGRDVWTTVKSGIGEISKLFPPNDLPAEIDSDHPQRVRGLVVDSSNPISSGADTQAYRQAFEKLDLLVVIDVAMTETAAMADYVLPASSQFEKWEATFFSFGFPTNSFHLRKPILEPRPGTLAEHEIYRRLVMAMGAVPRSFPWLKRIARLDRRWPRLRLFPLALKTFLKRRPELAPYSSIILAETLGEALPEGAKVAAPIWAACQMYVARHADAVRRAGIEDQGAGLAEAMFDRILHSPSGTLISTHVHEDNWNFIRRKGRKIGLDIPELLGELAELQSKDEAREAVGKEFPFVLVAGERRSYNANTIYRDPDWRKKDRDGALRMHPDDARRLGVQDGQTVVCRTERAEITVQVETSDANRAGSVTLPHGYGLEYPDDDGQERKSTGPQINLLTAADHCDPITKTPYHKYVPVSILVPSREAERAASVDSAPAAG